MIGFRKNNRAANQARDRKGRFLPSARRLTDEEVTKELRRLRRDPRYLEMDRRVQATRVIPRNPPRRQMNRYLRHPNRYDLEGYDAPLSSAVRVKRRKKR